MQWPVPARRSRECAARCRDTPESREPQSVDRAHPACEIERLVPRGDTAAPGPDVDLHEHVDAQVRRRRGLADLRRVAGVVDTHPDLGLAGKRHQMLDLAPAHDLVAHQHVGHAGLHQRLRLAHLLAAHPHRAEVHLQARDHRALVGLGVRANPHSGGGDVFRHRREIALEGVEIDEQSRRIDVGERHCDFSRWVIIAGVPPS